MGKATDNRVESKYVYFSIGSLCSAGGLGSKLVYLFPSFPQYMCFLYFLES